MYFQLCSASLQHGKAAGKEGTGTNGSSRSQGPESSRGDQPLHHNGRANTVTVSHWSNVLLVCVTGTWPLSPKLAFRIVNRAFFLQRTAWGLCTSHPAGIPIFLAQGHFTPWCFSCARGNLPVKALPAGTGAECVVMGTFSCCD